MRLRAGPALALLAISTLLFAACIPGGDSGSSGGSAGLGGEAVTYETTDGVIIFAEFLAPANASNPPVIILLHQFEGNHNQWKLLAPMLLENGYAVLAPDLRSFGGSDQAIIDGIQAPYELGDLDDMVFDVGAAIKWLEGRPGIDSSRIGVIGASIGANIAFVASHIFPEIGTTIGLSPSMNTVDEALIGRNQLEFAPRSMLFMSDNSEYKDARDLSYEVTPPVDAKIYGGRAAHGVELLEDEQVIQDIFGWLAEHL